MCSHSKKGKAPDSSEIPFKPGANSLISSGHNPPQYGLLANSLVLYLAQNGSIQSNKLTNG